MEMVTAIARPGIYNCTAFGYKRRFSLIGCLTMPLPCVTTEFLNVNSPGPIVRSISNSQTTGSEVSLGKCWCHLYFECSLWGAAPGIVFILQSHANLLGATFDALNWLQRIWKGPCPVPVAVAATPWSFDAVGKTEGQVRDPIYLRLPCSQRSCQLECMKGMPAFFG